MLAVHWTPVNNTKHILKKGITKSRNGLYCFPLTGHKSLDRWWIYFFNQCGVRHRKNYNGIVFRISEEDLPAYFGHWVGATTKADFKKPIQSIAELGLAFREAVIFRIGETISYEKGPEYLDHEQYLALGEQAISAGAQTFMDYYNDLGSMTFTLEDYQVVLSHSIPAKRIVSILPQGNEFGKVLRQQKLSKSKR